MMNAEIKNKILDYLKTTRIGASSSEIAKKIGHNRITVTKYLEILRAQKILDFDGVAQAKLWYTTKPHDKSTILIVDDEPHIVQLISLSLIQEKYSIIKAYSGQQALEQVHNQTPDIVLLDLMMPGMDGFEVCEKLKENALTRHIPVVILSAKDEVEDKLEGMRLGADYYITKPFDPMELEARVESIIRQTNVNQDMHPLTKLQGRLSIQSNIDKMLMHVDDFWVHAFWIENLPTFTKQQGYQKTDFVLTMMARILKQAVNGSQTYLGHTINNSFIAVSSDKGYRDCVIKHFADVFSYLYKNILELEVRSVNGQDYMDAGDLLKSLEVK